MKVGLIDVDGHNKKTRWGSAFPNLALMKLSAFYKKYKNAEVEWAQPNNDLFTQHHYDVIFASKIFTFSKDVDFSQYSYDALHTGGTGYKMKVKLPYMDVEEIAVDGRDRLVLMDNNILGAGDYALEQLQKIVDLKLKVDFNQAMDARLVNDTNAKLLAQIKWHPYIRFGCDTHKQIAECERAIELLKQYGWNGVVFLYCMLTDDFDETINRVMYWREKMMVNNKTYPHCQPFIDFKVRDYQPPKWQKDMARWSGVVSLKKSFPVMEYVPRKGFPFSMYRDIPALRKCKTKEEIADVLQGL